MPLSSVLGASTLIKPGVVTSSTRPAVPYEGQLIYETDTDRIAAYNGAAWVSASGLTFITGTSFSAAATVSLPTNTFTSNYSNYRVIFDITAGSTDLSVTMRLRAAGSDLTTANYNTALIGPSSAGTNTNLADVNQTSAKIGVGISSGGVNQAYLILDIIGPQLADKTLWSAQAVSQANNVANVLWYVGGGLYNTADQADALTLITSTGNITGTYRVYGYANS